MIKLLKDRRGAMPILVIGLIFMMLMMAILIMELGGVHQQYYTAETALQGACNSALEKNIDDAYRADGILKLNTEQAMADFQCFANRSLGDKYGLVISEITATEALPSLTVRGKITFSTMFSKYGFSDVTYDFYVKSNNVRLE